MTEDKHAIIEQTVKEVSFPMYNNRGWIKFIGILSIIYGVLGAMTIVGIIFAWLPIWLGILLTQAATRIEQAQHSGDKTAMINAQRSVSNYFLIYGVLILLGLILTGIFVIVAVTTGLLTNLPDLANEYY